MKLIKSYLFTLLVVVSGAAAGYGQTPEDLLVGEWHIDYSETLRHLSSARKAAYDSLDSAMKATLETTLSGQAFVFKGDGTFTALTEDGKRYNGTWSVVLQGRGLTLHYDQGTRFNQYIRTLNDDRLVLGLVEDDNASALFHSLYLTRSNRH